LNIEEARTVAFSVYSDVLAQIDEIASKFDTNRSRALALLVRQGYAKLIGLPIISKERENPVKDTLAPVATSSQPLSRVTKP
jgi:hypothetical protein